MRPDQLLYNHRRQAVRLAQQVYAGGEGAVYTLADDAGLVAKVYHKTPDPETTEKLRYMVGSAASELRERAAWPVATLHGEPGGAAIGFLMPRFADYRPLYNLYLPRGRQQHFPDAEWDFLIRAAQDCAAAFAAVHSRGAVIGDVNQQNVLVSARAAVGLIDCDSFQIEANGRVFPCTVGVGDFTPPEMQKRSFRGVRRTSDHDRFGLAVLIFQLLLMGKHPYAAIPTDDYSPDLEEGIRLFRFAYGREAAAMKIGPPPHAPTLQVLSPELRELFERAFGRGSDAPGRRPSAEDWFGALGRFREQLRSCPRDPVGHKAPSHLTECPWCRIMDAGGPNYFAGVAAVGAEFHFDEVRLTALCQKLGQNAGPPPEFHRPKASGGFRPPQPLPEEAVQSRTLMLIIGGVALLGPAGMLGCFCFKPLALFGFGILLVFGAWWLILFMNSPFGKEWRQRRQAVTEARLALQKEESEIALLLSGCQTQRGRLIGQSNQLRVSWEVLPSGYRGEYGELEKNREALARDDFLRSHLLTNQEIPKIGAGRKQTLASFGIETAFDVAEERIRKIKGFGDALTGNLLEWRRKILAEFRFNPATRVPRAEAQALALKYKQQQDSLRLQLDEEVKHLELLTRRTAQDWRPHLSRIRQLVATLAQAEGDLAALSRIWMA